MIPGWYRIYTPTIMDGPVVRYRLDSDVYDAEVSASRNGVTISGRWPVMPYGSRTAAVISILGLAERQADALRRGQTYDDPELEHRRA